MSVQFLPAGLEEVAMPVYPGSFTGAGAKVEPGRHCRAKLHLGAEAASVGVGGRRRHRIPASTADEDWTAVCMPRKLRMQVSTSQQ